MRTDIHAPKSADFNPEHYTFGGCYEFYSDEPHLSALVLQRRLDAVKAYEAEGYRFADHQSIGCGRCGHCGAGLRYTALMLHENKEMIWVGETCLGNTFESTREQFRAMRKAAAAQRKVSREIGILNRRLQQAAEKEPVLAVWQDAEDWARVEKRYPAFVRDIYSKAQRYELSPAQIAAAAKAIRQTDERREQVQQAVMNGQQDRVPQGRVDVKGVVLSRKQVETFNGIGYKLLVQDDKGWKVYVSEPSALYKQVGKGSRIAFSANITPSEDDPIFGFASRPTKARLLEVAG